MGCEQLIGANPRISARRSAIVDLNVDFYKNGMLADPFAIRQIEIYKTQVLPHNLVTAIPVLDPDQTLYPAPLCRDYVLSDGAEATADEVGAVLVPGRFHLPFFVPSDFIVPDVYFDLWYYFAENPCESGTVTDCDLSDPVLETKLLKCCHRFWIYPENWFCDDRLQTVNFAFEPLSQRFHHPETRPLEVGLMPLPLYDYNYNLVAPLIPFLQPTISISTQRCELLVNRDPCRIGIRQGSFKSNPWVVQYDLDTSLLLKGTYEYRIELTLPNGSSRVSRPFILVIA